MGGARSKSAMIVDATLIGDTSCSWRGAEESTAAAGLLPIVESVISATLGDRGSGCKLGKMGPLKNLGGDGSARRRRLSCSSLLS